MELRQNGPRHQRPAETQEQDDERPTVSDDRTDTPPMPAAEVMLPTARHAVLVCALVEGTSEHGRTVACLTDTLDEVGISASYRAFVQHGTGVVHRLFGKGSSTYYRLEVDGPVESGSSFQLPVLIAHCLREASRLYATVRERQELDPQTSRELVWATGSVAPLSYRVGEVGHVAEKLAFSRAKFEAALAAGRTIRIFVPAGNQDDADRATLDWIREKGIAFHAVTSVDEVLDILKLPPIPRAASTSGAPAGGWQGNPYRGLDPFGPEHRAVFFGRGRAREEALDRLRKAAAWGKPFLAITGRSGVGKSSLAMAGIAGDVEAASGPGFRLEVCRPTDGGAHPAGALAAAILRLTGSAAGDSTDAALTALAAGTATAGRDARRLLIVDQLEELFAAPVTDAEVAAFADLLDAAVRAGVWTIVTMRADAEGLVDRAPAIAKLASGDRIYRLDRPSRSEIAEIVEAPIAASGRRFADRRIPEGIAAMAAR
ncbi:MAG TPA: hypothetical protein PKA74_14970, partial [Bauldia sp.]|nr:hypothetical protein [Bauldia sp.]